MSDTTEVKFQAGCPIDRAALLLVEAADQAGSAWGWFNDIKISATCGQKAPLIVEDYHAEARRQQQQYERSEAGKAAIAAREARRKDFQSQHDALMRELASLDFSNDEAVLNWICRMQEPSDHVGVIIRRDTIVSAFAANGFAANENCGPDYKDGDRRNMFRYLVGQALSGLTEGPAIHPIIHKFADQWRARFTPTAKSNSVSERTDSEEKSFVRSLSDPTPGALR